MIEPQPWREDEKVRLNFRPPKPLADQIDALAKEGATLTDKRVNRTDVILSLLKFALAFYRVIRPSWPRLKALADAAGSTPGAYAAELVARTLGGPGGDGHERHKSRPEPRHRG